MTEAGTGKLIYELRKKINQITSEISELHQDSTNIPTLIDSTNILRTNDNLLEINSKNAELLLVYRQYVKELEDMLEIVFSIQNDLKEILKTQSSLISDSQTSKKKKLKKKSSKK